MMTTSVTSTSYPMSDTSKQEYCRNNPSPPTSLTPLDSMDPFENSLSADTFLDSDFGSQGLSPAGSIHSSLYSDNQVVYQDYLLLDLMAYGLPATEGGSLPKLAQMLPYPRPPHQLLWGPMKIKHELLLNRVKERHLMLTFNLRPLKTGRAHVQLLCRPKTHHRRTLTLRKRLNA
ncbi:hypothetical protein H4Q26_005089 [Puccinia striiformis f. sp. tritici PST-130]|nr:hypothetical protein H4Q26_005089 [Puccinia striiformis f. sp. tritici PST-130]